ncbi:MAG: type II toxin-antitoxin system RelB/DinJ family antitoxin [Candidatus Tectomicrobia bacterium]|nr:type II toxin-antitoxin system RelB/DinJ family antitoxin [Candidatus Tectomicrobia bacterium]
MSKAARIEARIDETLKQAAEAVFAQLGLSPSEAIRIFYRQVELHQGFPFDIRVPNAETVEAMKEIEEHPERMIRHSSVDEMFKSWEADTGPC